MKKKFPAALGSCGQVQTYNTVAPVRLFSPDISADKVALPEKEKCASGKKFGQIVRPQSCRMKDHI